MRLRHKVVQHIVLCCLGVMLKEDVTTPYGKSGSKMEGWISEECYPASLNTLAVISCPLATCTSHRWQNLQKVPEQAGYIGVQSVAFDLQPVTEIIRSVVNKGHLGHSSLVLVGNVLSQLARGGASWDVTYQTTWVCGNMEVKWQSWKTFHRLKWSP